VRWLRVLIPTPALGGLIMRVGVYSLVRWLGEVAPCPNPYTRSRWPYNAGRSLLIGEVAQ
jgi:hypothetical protein